MNRGFSQRVTKPEVAILEELALKLVIVFSDTTRLLFHIMVNNCRGFISEKLYTTKSHDILAALVQKKKCQYGDVCGWHKIRFY